MSAEYWKPEPQRHGFTWWLLLVPAVIYSAGVVVYAHNAFVPGMAGENGHAIGSALMVAGGELGTLVAASEVFEKARRGETVWWDWLGMAVSLIATLGNLFVVYASMTSISAWWLPWVRTNGPWILLLCSGVDFYAGVMEFGFYNAGFEERWNAWNDNRHTWEAAQQRKSEQMSDARATQSERSERTSDAQANAQTLKQTQGANEQTLNSQESDAEQTHERHVCEWCGRSFATVQARSAHMAHCTAYQEAQAAQKAPVARGNA